MMNREKNLPVACPSCGGRLDVQSLHCPCCATRVEGDYRLPLFMLLGEEEQRFVLDFVKSSGSLKEMAAQLGLSYPTVRNRLDDIIAHIRTLEK